jgi:hypothetical protein
VRTRALERREAASLLARGAAAGWVSSSVAEIKRFSAFAIPLNELESRLVMRDALASDA